MKVMHQFSRPVVLTFFPLLLMGAVGVADNKADPRLASVRKAYVVPVDELSDDKVLASCVIDLIHTITPIEAVTAKSEADVVLKVSAHIPGAGARFALGMMGGTPSAKMEAELLDGTPLWSDGAKNRKLTGGAIGAARNGDKLACGLANGLLTALRDAMGKARGK